MYMRGEVHMSLSLCDSCDSPISPVFFGPRVRSIRFGPTTRGIQPQFVGDRHPRCDPAIASIAAVEPWPSQSATFQPGNMAIWWPKGPFFSPSPALKTKVSQKTKSKWFSLGRSCWTVSWGFLCCRTSKQLLSRSASWATQSFACQEVVGELVVFLVQKWLQFPPLCFSDHEPVECRPWRHQFAVGTCSHKPLQSQISSNLCLSCRWGHRAANHPRSPDTGVVKGFIITRGGPNAGNHQRWQCLEGRDLYSASWNLYQPTNPSENAEFWASKPPLLVVPAAALRISVGWGNLPDEWDDYKTARRNLDVGYSPFFPLSL